MGAAPPTNATRPLSAKPHMYWGARQYWANARERLAAFVSRRLFQHSGATLDILLKLYTSLGGHCLADSPIYVKGGAAAWLYLCQQCCLLPASVANAIGEVPPPADLDFGSVAPKGNTIEAAANALLWIQELADGLKMNKVWPLWEVRSDTRRGEAFFHGTVGLWTEVKPVLPRVPLRPLLFNVFLNCWFTFDIDY